MVLYDRPPSVFKSVTIEEKHELYRILSQDYIPFNSDSISDASENVIEETRFTRKFSDGKVESKLNRPAILISSTSWTPDEDFGILFKALDEYEKSAELDAKHYPKLVCVITGKGPLKAHYINLIAQKDWQFVKVVTPWLKSDLYPKMLAASDLGVCLHWSSSGLDLPMKIVDMFGCGLPVCAVNFKW